MKYQRPTKNKKIRIWVRDKFICQLRISPYCIKKLSPDTASVDHVKPLSKGGTNEPSNLVTACKPCNNLKADREHTGNLPTTKLPAPYHNVAMYKKQKKVLVQKRIRSANKKYHPPVQLRKMKFRDFRHRNSSLYGI